MSRIGRRRMMSLAGGALALASCGPAREEAARGRGLRIKRLRVTPLALPDPPLLAASGCHGPYFLRSLVEVDTDEGIVGIGETYGQAPILQELDQAKRRVEGASAFAYRAFEELLEEFHPAVYAGIEMACLDAAGKASGRRLCELLGGPVREEPEFAAYLFYRYAADDPRVLDDARLADARGKGGRALDPWGEVRNAAAMAEMAAGFRREWGFRVLKLKAGVLPPDEELGTLRAMHERFGAAAPLRIDPNGRWSVATATRLGKQLKDLPLEYYEDPVRGQEAMAEVRAATGLPLATNSCVSRWPHVKPAVAIGPIDVLLADLYWFGGLGGTQALGKAARHLGWGLGYHSNNHAGVTMAAMIHAAASTPEFSHALDTHYVWLPEGEDILDGPKLPIRNGRMRIPEGPGLGVRIDRDRVARAHERWRKSGMTGRDDAATMRIFEPGWTPSIF